VIALVLVMPPNQLAGQTLAGVLLALYVIYIAAVRSRFHGPAWAEKQ